MKRTEPEKKLLVEVSGIEEGMLWAAAGADVLQPEKFPPEQVAACRHAVNGVNPRVLLAAAGGVHAGNAEACANAGADLLVTSAAYGAPPRDVAVAFAPC